MKEEKNKLKIIYRWGGGMRKNKRFIWLVYFALKKIKLKYLNKGNFINYLILKGEINNYFCIINLNKKKKNL